MKKLTRLEILVLLILLLQVAELIEKIVERFVL